MPGPMSAPQGWRRDPRQAKEGPHGRCQDRERCAGPGCRVSSGKTYHKRTGAASAREQADLATFLAATAAESENAA